MLAWIGQVVTPTRRCVVRRGVSCERVPGQPRRRRPASAVRWRQYARCSRVATHDVSHCSKRRHHALRPARVEAGDSVRIQRGHDPTGPAPPHRARLHRTRAHRWRPSLDTVAVVVDKLAPVDAKPPEPAEPPERVNAPEKPQRRRPHWPRPSLPRPSSPAVTKICDEHGGDGGTLSDGTPRCPQCRQRRAPP